MILASLAELSQFRKGLSVLGVTAALKDYPHLLHSYFSVEHDDELTSGIYVTYNNIIGEYMNDIIIMEVQVV